MGVAGGELLIPTITLLYAVDVKTAGSLSLVVSLPTMLVAFARYSRDQAFGVLRQHAPVRRRDDSGLGHGQPHRRPGPGRRPDRAAHPRTGRAAARVSGQTLGTLTSPL